MGIGLHERSLSAEETATALRVHVETVRRLARRGEIPAFKVGREWRFRAGDVDRWKVAARALYTEWTGGPSGDVINRRA